MALKAFSMSENFQGGAFMLLAMASFAMGDGVMKNVADELPLSQILVCRGIFSILGLSFIIFVVKKMKPDINQLSWPLLIRVVGEIIASWFFLTALFNMDFANTQAIMQALPLTVTVGAAFFFGEQVGWRRISAILVGLFGVILMIQPGLEGFNVFSLYCLVAVFGTTMRDLATRRLPKNTQTLFVTYITTITITFFGLALALFETWSPIIISQISYLALASVFLFFGYTGIIASMRVGEAGFVTPFRYSSLIFAVLIGLIFFGEIPNVYTIIGSCIVVGSGIYTLYRERKLLKRQA